MSHLRTFTWLSMLILLGCEAAVDNSDDNATSGSCAQDGTTYANGDLVPSGDNCNTCSCMDGQMACTMMACGTEVACGARAGDTCEADQYCAYLGNGELCGAGDATAYCQARPTVCTEEYAPVCGCDQVTYSNACTAAAAGTGILAEGACAGNASGSCSLDGIEVPEGATLDSGDGCNRCSCSKGQLACTLMACVEPASCGGDGDATCADDEYCGYTADAGSCGYADAPSICLKRPSACVDTIAKACGCDGNNYDNPCLAAMAGVGVLSAGNCS